MTDSNQYQKDLKEEIANLNIEIETIEKTLGDHRLMQTGDFTRKELLLEKENLMEERNRLISQVIPADGKCDTCRGTGALPGTSDDCPDCMGSGLFIPDKFIL